MVLNRKILILFFHPAVYRSRVNRKLLEAANKLDGVRVREMYEIYPDFHIDVAAEQDLLLEHDLIVWQHPFYWYSSPSLLKEWLDLVLEHGFAYGSQGRALEGKMVVSAISTGGQEKAYHTEGGNRYTIRQLLAPFDQTVSLCRMHYLPPFVTHGTHLLEADKIEEAARHYAMIIQLLRHEERLLEKVEKLEYLNQLKF